MSAPDDVDLLAAEYVLGTLDPDERDDVTRRLARDAALARAVEDWQMMLSPLSETTPGVAPPAGLFRRIETRLFAARPSRRELRAWQVSTGAFAALAAALIVWIAVSGGPAGSGSDRLVAVLQKDAGAPAMVLEVDLKSRRLTVRAIAPATPAGKAYELWLIDAAVGPPRSLGLVPAEARTEASLASYAPAVISDATYAITLEPAGGAPGGKPTGSPILSGRLVPSAR